MRIAVRLPEWSRRVPAVAATKARVALKALHDGGFVRLLRGRYAVTARSFDRTQADEVAEGYRRREELDAAKQEQLMAYAYSARCRWRTLLDYFDDAPEWERCGSCDNCRHPETNEPRTAARTAAQPAETRTDSAGLELGERVTAPRYGEGTVTDTAADIVTVAFPDGERRRFMQSFVKGARAAKRKRSA